MEKPFTEQATAAKADLWQSRNDRPSRWIDKLPELQRMLQRHASRIAIKHKGKILFIKPCEIVMVHAQGNYVSLELESGCYILRETISAMEEKLEPYGFVRIHRSLLVNSSWAEEIRPYLTGEYGLRLRGGKEVTVTRTYKKNIKLLAELWFSNDAFLEADVQH
jgi:two-component system LytT family response regulator